LSDVGKPLRLSCGPRRDPKDIHFVNPADGTPETFIETRKIY